VAEQTEGEKPQFKTLMPQTPTTKFLAVGTFAPGTDMSQVQRILPTEKKSFLRHAPSRGPSQTAAEVVRA
jgi:hypothetical protein